VPPLHQRDTYIVSPNADMRKLRSACAQYAKLFPPHIPALPKMLAQLSQGTPRPYKMFIPSKSHKPLYMDVLAWLMRGGWVTQLRTFGWVRVPGTIQAAVAEEGDVLGLDDPKHDSSEPSKNLNNGDDDAGEPDRETTTRTSYDHRLPEQQNHATRSLSPGRASGFNSPASVSSVRTAIPLHLPVLNLPDSPLASNPPPHRPSILSNSLVTSSQDPQMLPMPKLILHPTKASGLESRWLAAISREMEASEGKEVREAWERCLKYLNGEHALEKISVREGWKRKKVEGWRAVWERMGVLREWRGW
jgi:hypothetical protein